MYVCVCVYLDRYIRSERSIILINFCLSIISSNILILVGQTQTHNKVWLNCLYILIACNLFFVQLGSFQFWQQQQPKKKTLCRNWQLSCKILGSRKKDSTCFVENVFPFQTSTSYNSFWIIGAFKSKHMYISKFKVMMHQNHIFYLIMVAIMNSATICFVLVHWHSIKTDKFLESKVYLNIWMYIYIWWMLKQN